MCWCHHFQLEFCSSNSLEISDPEIAGKEDAVSNESDNRKDWFVNFNYM